MENRELLLTVNLPDIAASYEYEVKASVEEKNVVDGRSKMQEKANFTAQCLNTGNR